jgi:hypothetical protein
MGKSVRGRRSAPRLLRDRVLRSKRDVPSGRRTRVSLTRLKSSRAKVGRRTLQSDANVLGTGTALALMDQVNRHASQHTQLGGRRCVLAGVKKSKARQAEACVDDIRQHSGELPVATCPGRHGSWQRVWDCGLRARDGTSCIDGLYKALLSEAPEILSRDADQVGEEHLLRLGAVENHQEVFARLRVAPQRASSAPLVRRVFFSRSRDRLRCCHRERATERRAAARVF